MVTEALSDVLECIVQPRLKVLRPNDKNSFARKCLKDSERILQKAIQDLNTSKVDLNSVYPEITRALNLASLGGAFRNDKQL
jgi:hypothetical protein